jgi:hypothetical protein
MRRWNCKRMAGAMPLFIAGDLSDKREVLATAHLSTCEECRRLADEFSESSGWLIQSCVLPEFNAEFYAGIRQAVLEELSHDRLPAKPTLFRDRWLYVSSLAVAIIVAGIVFQYHRTTPEKLPEVALRLPVIELSRPDRVLVAAPSSSPQLSGLPQAPRKSHRVTSVRKSNALYADPSAADNRPATTQATWPAASVETTLQGAVPGASASSSSGRASTPAITRFEIRTADPNIRIIWFGSQQPSGSGATYQDQNLDENGDRK